MVSISIVYPTCSRAGLTPKSEAKTTHPTSAAQRNGWLSHGPAEPRDMYINGAILHSFVYLAILPVRIQLLSPVPMVRWHESRLRYNPLGLAPASDLTSFRRRHYRARLPSCSFLKHRLTLWRISLLFAKD